MENSMILNNYSFKKGILSIFVISFILFVINKFYFQFSDNYTISMFILNMFILYMIKSIKYTVFKKMDNYFVIKMGFHNVDLNNTNEIIIKDESNKLNDLNMIEFVEKHNYSALLTLNIFLNSLLIILFYMIS